MKSLSCVQLFATPWTVAHQAPLSMGFSRQEYWSGVPFPSPGDLSDPGIDPGSPTLQAGYHLSTGEDPNENKVGKKKANNWRRLMKGFQVSQILMGNDFFRVLFYIEI